MLTKKQKSLYLTIIIAISIIFLFLGLFIGKNHLKENDKKEEETNETTQNYYKDLYYTENGRNIYIYGKDRILVNGDDLIKKENIWETLENYKKEFDTIGTLKDGGTTIYRTSGNSTEMEKYTMITCNTLDENKDIYFGPFDMDYQKEFCENNTHEPFIRTYNILSVEDSNDENYIYITIKGFNQEEVQTLKIRKYLNPNIQANNAYEFTFKLKKDLDTTCDNIQSIFKNSELIKIEHTDKMGLEQINEEIKS